MLNLAALCCMVATLCFYITRSPRRWRTRYPALIVLVAYTVITATLVHIDTPHGSETTVRLFYAASCFFMAGMVSVFLVNARLIAALVLGAALLAVLTLATDLIIDGVIHNGARLTRSPGPLYSLYLLAMLSGVVGQIALGIWRWSQHDEPQRCVEWRAFAVAAVPTHLMVIVLVVMMVQDTPSTTAVDVLHLAVIAFCAVLVYAASGALLPAVTLPRDHLRSAQQMSLAHIMAIESLLKRTEIPTPVVLGLLKKLSDQATAPWVSHRLMRVRGSVIRCVDLRSLAICRRTRRAASAAIDSVTASGTVTPLYVDHTSEPPKPVYFV
ncbi:MAG: hypothetical protein AAF460_05050 [Pseudomonadota bacterium]